MVNLDAISNIGLPWVNLKSNLFCWSISGSCIVKADPSGIAISTDPLIFNEPVIWASPMNGKGLKLFKACDAVIANEAVSAKLAWLEDTSLVISWEAEIAYEAVVANSA